MMQAVYSNTHLKETAKQAYSDSHIRKLISSATKEGVIFGAVFIASLGVSEKRDILGITTVDTLTGAPILWSDHPEALQCFR